MPFAIRRLGPGDEEEVIAAARLFDEQPRRDATERFLASATHHMFLASGPDAQPLGFVSGVETTHLEWTFGAPA